MKASANRTQDNESRAVANNVSCKREEREAVRFVDNSSHTKSIAQLQAIADRSVNPHDVQMRKLFAIINNSPQRKTPVLPGVTQKKGPLDEEELQFKSKEAVQKKGPLDEEELQFKKDETVQCKGPLDEEELQFKAEEPVQKQENKTGLPDDLKAGVENLSGMAMDDVRVHYNSSQPAQLNAYAYTQGQAIYVAPGQEKHLPHEAWHVVQQKQGRVQPTMQMKGGVNVNDDAGLEKEADVMGGKALQFVDNRQRLSLNSNSAKEKSTSQLSTITDVFLEQKNSLETVASNIIQRKITIGGKPLSSSLYGQAVEQINKLNAMRRVQAGEQVADVSISDGILILDAMTHDAEDYDFSDLSELILSIKNIQEHKTTQEEYRKAEQEEIERQTGGKKPSESKYGIEITRGQARHQQTEEEEGVAQTPRAPKQLHLFVNLEGIPANRAQVFLQHFMGKLQASGATASAMNIAKGEGKTLVNEDLLTKKSLTVGVPEEKAGNKNTEQGVIKAQCRVNSTHGEYKKKLEHVSTGRGGYDEVVIIGVAMPGKLDKDNLHKSYQNVSGISDISGLSSHVQGIVSTHLKDGGHLRVQLCHAGSVKVNEGDTFEASVIPPEKKEMTVSAPKSFSVIGDEGDFVDMTTTMGIFDNNKGNVRSKLLGKIPDEEGVASTLNDRETKFRESVKGGGNVSSKISDVQYGSSRTMGAVVDRRGNVSFRITGFSLHRRPGFGFYVPPSIEKAFRSGLIKLGSIFTINGATFRLVHDSIGEVFMTIVVMGG